MTKDIYRSWMIGDESGAGTAWWVFWMIIFLIFGGLAADSSNAWRMRAELQATADAAALSGVISLPVSNAAAKSAAIDIAERNMPTTMHGNVLVPGDVTVGIWAGGVFTPDEDTPDAVRVVTRRDSNNANRLATYFLRLTGVSFWDVNAVAIAQRYFPDCLKNSAIISATIVDFQSNNVFYPGICIHANDHVEANNGNEWKDGVRVSMPFKEDMDTPKSSWEGDPDVVGDGHNEGLEAALHSEYFYPKIIDDITPIIESFKDPTTSMGTEYWPSYLTDYDGDGKPFSVEVTYTEDGVTYTVDEAFAPATLIETIDASAWDINNYEEGKIYYVKCKKASNTVTIGASATTPLKNVAFISNCNIKIGNDGVVYNAVIASTAGGDDKIKPWDNIIDLGQGTILGLDDGCAPGGDVKIVSTASISGPAKTQYYGVQMLATMDINIAAQAAGVEGINIQAGGTIDWTSNNAFGPVCGGNPGGWEAAYFRLVY